MPDIVVVETRIDPGILRRLVDDGFGDMVKYVVDVRRGVVAAGGELHADAEQVLLASGSRQEDLWGANYYPATSKDACIEYTALINIRPLQDNRGMEIESDAIRRRIRELTFELLGEGEEL